jgi:hypothetical protein
MKNKIIINTKEELIDFLDQFPEGTYQILNDFYTNQEEHAYSVHNIIPSREEIIEEVWFGDIKYNFDNVEFKITNEEAIQIIEEYID